MTSRIDIRDASLIDFVPESIASDSDIIALSLALDPELRDVGAAIVEAVILPRIAEVDDDILDELAWAFRLNRLQIWDVASTEAKRALLVNIFAIRKKSGTLFSVRRLFGLLDLEAVIVEWWQEIPLIVAVPYSWRIRIFARDIGITRDQIVQLAELVHRFAPTRSYLREFAVEDDRTAPLSLITAIQGGRHTTIPFGP